MTALLPRSTWTDHGPIRPLTRLDPTKVRGIALHWPGSTGTWGPNPTRDQSARRLEQERVQHTSKAANDPSKPWADFAYNLAVDLAGRLWDGRGIAYRSAANGSAAANDQWIALTVLMGTRDAVTPAAVDAVRAARALVLERYPRATAVVGHRDLYPTECCGDRLYHLIQAGAFTAVTPTAATRETPMPASDLTPAALDAVSGEVWGPNSSFVTRLPADLDPARYAERTLPDGSPVISPITTLRWAMEAARTALAEVQSLRGEVAALRQELAAKGVAGGGVDPAALAKAVRAEFAAHPLT